MKSSLFLLSWILLPFVVSFDWFKKTKSSERDDDVEDRLHSYEAFVSQRMEQMYNDLIRDNPWFQRPYEHWKAQQFPTKKYDTMNEEDILAQKAIMKTYPDEYVFIVDVPGIPKDHVKLFLTPNKLIIKGDFETCATTVTTKDSEKKTPQENRFCLDRKIHRHFKVPEDGDMTSMKAQYKDGVIYISLLRSDEHRNWKQLELEDYHPNWRETMENVKDKIRRAFTFGTEGDKLTPMESNE